MIGRARKLSEIKKDIFLAYLHLLHVTEHLEKVRPSNWAYRNIQAHWVRSKSYRAHWLRIWIFLSLFSLSSLPFLGWS